MDGWGMQMYEVPMYCIECNVYVYVCGVWGEGVYNGANILVC